MRKIFIACRVSSIGKRTLSCNQFYLPGFGSSQTNVEKLLNNEWLKKKNGQRPNPLYRRKNSEDFTTEYNRKICIGFCTVCVFWLAKSEPFIYFESSPASNREFASCVLNAKLILFTKRINAMIHSLPLCYNFLLFVKIAACKSSLKIGNK